MPIPVHLENLERASRIAVICADLTRCLAAMDALGLDLAAIQLDHSLALIRSATVRDAQINGTPDFSRVADFQDR